MNDLFEPTREEQIACIKREIRMRKRVYPHRIEKGRMTADKADYEIRIMQSILEDLIQEAERTQNAQTEQTSASEPETEPETEKKSVSTAPEWPKKRGGVLVDIRGVPWSSEFHCASKALTKDWTWRKRRGGSDERIAEIENPTVKEKPKTEKHKKESEDQPELLSERWFDRGISQANDMQELWEFEQLLVENEHEMDADVIGLRGKIADRRAELEIKDENRAES